VAAEETVFEPEPSAEPARVPEPQLVPVLPPVAEETRVEQPPREPVAAGGTPFSSSTLAELYLKQGLVDRAVGVYRQLLAGEPGNERARSRLAEIERMLPTDDGRAARRRQLERTIAGLEALLAVVQRR
jgi:hypothetical protein